MDDAVVTEAASRGRGCMSGACDWGPCHRHSRASGTEEQSWVGDLPPSLPGGRGSSFTRRKKWSDGMGADRRSRSGRSGRPRAIPPRELRQMESELGSACAVCAALHGGRGFLVSERFYSWPAPASGCALLFTARRLCSRRPFLTVHPVSVRQFVDASSICRHSAFRPWGPV
ncbi:hypothetical protein SEVIR_5G073101v4 [Setaria viridis]|uniref:Uncharacterized protein n=1 Tax=Setaria viridis TaxID=4556 RepID=A0A4U6UH15_SETVI|nr:hypothetical protein SEVIR_5G073101v2 [Setaria viridis]